MTSATAATKPASAASNVPIQALRRHATVPASNANSANTHAVVRAPDGAFTRFANSPTAASASTRPHNASTTWYERGRANSSGESSAITRSGAATDALTAKTTPRLQPSRSSAISTPTVSGTAPAAISGPRQGFGVISPSARDRPPTSAPSFFLYNPGFATGASPL